MLLFASQKSGALGKRVAAGLNTRLGKIEKEVFPDGEIYIRILEDVSGRDCVLVHTAEDNDDIIELILVLSALAENRAKRITCIIPYLAYSRQDKAFKPGEAVSAQVILKIIDSFATEIVLLNAHFLGKPGRFEFGGVKITNLDAFPLLAKYFSKVKDAVVIAPDEGTLQYAADAAKVIGCPSDYLIKKRLSGEDVEMKPKNIDISGKNAIILDDIISTGGTVVKALEKLKSQGAAGGYAGCVHGVFSKGTRMFGSLNEVVCTDTIPGDLSKISVAPLLIDFLKKR